MAAPVKMHEELELDIESLAFGGNGVARHDGFVVFVRRGLPGDRVRARVTKVKRGFAEALATDVVTAGPLRVEAPCEHYPTCGGCRFQDLAYEAQIEQKHAQVHDALQRIAGIAEPPLEPIVPCKPEIFFYRNKMEYSFAPSDDGPGARPAPGRTLGRGDRHPQVLVDDRPRQRDPQRGARLGARGRPAGVLAGGRQRLPAPSDRARGPQHGPGARAARHRAGREVREAAYLVEVLRRFPEVRSIHWADQRPSGRGDEPAVRAPLGRGRDRGGARRTALPRAAERVHADEHVHGREAVRARARRGAAHRQGDGVGSLLRDRHDRPLAREGRADGVGDRGVGGVGRVRARERRAERDHERRVLRRQRRRGRRGAPRALRRRPTSSSSIRRAPGSPARRCGASARSARRASSTSRATRRRSPAT